MKNHFDKISSTVSGIVFGVLYALEDLVILLCTLFAPFFIFLAAVFVYRHYPAFMDGKTWIFNFCEIIMVVYYLSLIFFIVYHWIDHRRHNHKLENRMTADMNFRNSETIKK